MIIRLKGDTELKPVDIRRKTLTRKPVFPYGFELEIILEFYHDDDTAYDESELTVFNSFQFGIDEDFDFATDPPVLADNSTTSFTISGNTISFALMTDSPDFKTMIGDSRYGDGWTEFKAYKPGKTKPTLRSVFEIQGENSVIADGTGVPGSNPELYLTAAEIYALINSSKNLDVPADAATAFELGRLDAGRGFEVSAMFTDEVSGNDEGAALKAQVFLSGGTAKVTNKSGFSDIANLNIVTGINASISGALPDKAVNLVITTTAGNALKMNLKATSI